MRFTRSLLIVPAAILAVACGRNDSNKRVDDALNSDLSLAAQARPYTALDSISAAERAAQMQGIAPVGYLNGQPVYSTPQTSVRTTTPVRRTSTVRRSSSSSGGSRVVYSAPRREVIVKHTKRDAAIGAAAGAVLGAVTSRDKVKGAVIGGVAGGILSGVIGYNIDKSKR
jgi:hypothetical protein